jgi:hypothetical protein
VGNPTDDWQRAIIATHARHRYRSQIARPVDVVEVDDRHALADARKRSGDLSDTSPCGGTGCCRAGATSSPKPSVRPVERLTTS